MKRLGLGIVTAVVVISAGLGLSLAGESSPRPAPPSSNEQIMIDLSVPAEQIVIDLHLAGVVPLETAVEAYISGRSAEMVIHLLQTGVIRPASSEPNQAVWIWTYSAPGLSHLGWQGTWTYIPGTPPVETIVVPYLGQPQPPSGPPATPSGTTSQSYEWWADEDEWWPI